MTIPGGIRTKRSFWLCLALLLPACSLQFPAEEAHADPSATPANKPVLQAPTAAPAADRQYAALPARPIAKPRWRTIPPSFQITGVASWYGIPFHGRLTANGEVFDMNSLSAAHKTLPFDTRVRVTNLENGASLVLRINDRGPFVGDRVIDVSRRAARLLGFQHAGLANVRIVLEPNEQTASR